MKPLKTIELDKDTARDWLISHFFHSYNSGTDIRLIQSIDYIKKYIELLTKEDVKEIIMLFRCSKMKDLVRFLENWN